MTDIKNDCTPASVFGGFDQYLFLGCSVSSFSASAGWNGQQSELTVQIVEDTCAPPSGSPKKYYDQTLTLQDWTAADPGFYGLTTEIIGCPVYFRVGDFEFSGIIQSWEESHSTTGNPTYLVKIVDPSTLLARSELIINEYAGGVLSLPNIFNIFGYLESLGAPCPQTYQSSQGVYHNGSGAPDGATFGSPAQAYGGANNNLNGMQWNQMLDGITVSTATKPVQTDLWSPFGRIQSRAPSSPPAEYMGLLSSGTTTDYYLDLYEVPTAPQYWRFNGTNVSILDAVSQICEDSIHDYTVQLVPVDDIDNPGVGSPDLVIKVRTVDRDPEPTAGTIDTFIGDADNKVMDYRKGKEFRNEYTESFVIGGPKQTFYQAEQSFDPEGDGNPSPPEQDDMIIPYFGLDLDGNAIIPYKDSDGFWEFEIHTDDLSLQLFSGYGFTIPSTLTINERELIAATGGYDAWSSYATSFSTPLMLALNLNTAFRGLYNTAHMLKILNNRGTNKLRPADFVVIQNAVGDHDQEDLEIAQAAFAWISKLADEYYGKQFQVRVPYVCNKIDLESGRILSGEEPAQSGWTDFANVLGLTHTSIYTDFFALEDGKLGAFCRFDNTNGLEIANLSLEDYLVYNNQCWIKLGVQEEGFVYVDKETLFSPRVIVNLPQPVLRNNPCHPDGLKDANLMYQLLTNFCTNTPMINTDAESAVKDALATVGAHDIHEHIPNRAEMPDACGFGIKSNVLMYGPWGSYGATGPIKVEHDDGLVPWEYGSRTTMSLAGASKADEGVSDNQVNEEGQITVVGYPNVPLVGELLDDMSGNQLYENRSQTIVSPQGIRCIKVDISSMSGTNGPTITGVSTQVGPNGLQTTYTIRTWTPKFGKFARGNAERLKQWGQTNARFQKSLRAFSLQRLKRNQVAFLNKVLDRRKAYIAKARWGAGSKTPSELLVGQNADWNAGDYQRPVVGMMPVHEAATEIGEDYGNKAFMSLDGLIRPVSVGGSGDLPQYANPGGNCQITSHRGAQPPVDKTGEAGTLDQYNLDIDINYLDPFANPSGNTASRSDTANHGHDVEIVGRGASAPSDSLIMPIQGYNDNDDFAESDHTSDYRMLALKGPLLLHGWGYDLDGFPVPNNVDTDSGAKAGNFVSTGLKTKFLDNFLRKPETWPVAPVDLRFDRERGVWTVPDYRTMEVELQEDIADGATGVGVRVSGTGPTLYDTDGATITAPEIEVKNVVGSTLLEGDIVLAEFDRYECIYKVTESKSVPTYWIMFTINYGYTIGDDPDSPDCADKEGDAPTSVPAQITKKPCGIDKVPEEDDSGVVTVHDEIGSFLAGRESQDIDGKTGFAVYLGDEAGENCKWVITWIDWFRDVVVVTDVVDTGEAIRIDYSTLSVWDDCEVPSSLIETEDCESSG